MGTTPKYMGVASCASAEQSAYKTRSPPSYSAHSVAEGFNYFFSCPAVGALCVPAYNPNHAAPAPTNTDISPDCSKLGSGKSMNQNVAKYRRNI